MSKQRGFKWMIRSDDDSGHGWSSFQIRRENDSVISWVLLNPTMLREVAKAALEIADFIEQRPLEVDEREDAGL